MHGSASARGVSPSDLRRINERVVLEAMTPGERYRLTELMRRTGLTRVTVTDVLRQLQDKGWVAAQASSGAAAGRRRSSAGWWPRAWWAAWTWEPTRWPQRSRTCPAACCSATA